MSAPSEWALLYDVVNVSDLPVPNEIRGPACMTGPKVWLRRRSRKRIGWLAPRLGPRDCCWHHQVSWGDTAEVAVRLVRQAHAAGARDGTDIWDYVNGRLEGEGLGHLEQDAIRTLVGPGEGIQLNDDTDPQWRYQDGQHRVAAHLDQGVRETVVQRVEELDLATGLSATD